MKIISLNINGLRAFYNRGGEGVLLDRLITENNPDIILFQETKCSSDDFNWWLSDYADKYQTVGYSNSNSKGYAGVGAMISKELPECKCCQQILLPNNSYDSGRIIQLEFSDFYVIGVYVLNSADKEGLRKDWDIEFHRYLKGLDKPFVVLGDFNVCSRSSDCYAFEYYFDNMAGVMGFEIDAFHFLMDDLKLIDSWLHFHPNQIDTYSWFSYRGASRYKNQGFRLDYAVVSQDLKNNLKSCEILGKPIEYSDHSPILLELNV